MHVNKNTLLGVLLSSSVLMSANAQAAEIEVSVTNLTHGSFFTPLLVTAHDASSSLFSMGEPASAALQAMAEGGDISGLVTQVGGEDADTITNPAQGLLAAGATTTTTLMTQEGNTRLSIVGMILPSNDGFIGLNSIKIPTKAGVYHYGVNGYDAGTEANNELVSAEGGAVGTLGMPNPPAVTTTGTGGTGVTTAEENKTVHIHRNILGDMDNAGGKSDADSRIHRWLNPVARVMITVK